MFFFKKKPTPEEQKSMERQQSSLKALESGGIPLVARERLEHQMKQGGKLFSSDLTTKEFLLSRQAGYQPIGQVMGCAFMNISLWGMQQARRATGELTDVSQALLHARRLAVQRLRQEAELLQATGVIGIRLTLKRHGDDNRMVEFTAIGTAIKVPDHEQSKPFTSLLSGQEFWQLRQAGYWPVDVCMGVCTYYVWSDPQTRKLLYSWWGGNNQNNAEIPAYTQGFYTAREMALSRMTQDIEDHGADGGVGMIIDEDIKDIEYEINDRKYHDFLVNFSMMGTSVKQETAPVAKRTNTMVIYDLAQRGYRNVDLDDELVGSGRSNVEID